MSYEPKQQSIWNERITKAIKIDEIADDRAEADRIEPFINKQSRQIQAFDWVYHWHVKQEIAAEKMGISQPALNKLLKEFFAKHPSMRPKPQDWKGRPDEIPDTIPAGSSRDIVACEGFFTEAGHGYHEPGKTSLSKKEIHSNNENNEEGL